MQRQRSIPIILLLLLLLCMFVGVALLTIGSKEKEKWSYPPSLCLNGELYQRTGGYMENTSDSLEYIGEIQSEVKHWEVPEKNLEVNISGYLGNEVWRIDSETVIIEYTGPAYGEWRKFRLIRNENNIVDHESE